MTTGRLLHEFCESLSFSLDDFQRQACQVVEEGRGVLVAAPTGAGKTLVGEFGVHVALARGGKAFYTTPIKALSNQKYADLVRRYGTSNVGLLTGDASINGEAPIVVMTTEVLRNMLYAGSGTLAGVSHVVMDEVHYLADRLRGAVWEEVIIHLPAQVCVISLSATVSNAEEFGEWLSEVRGGTEVIVSEHRPVPLWQHMMVEDDLYDLFVDDGKGAIRRSSESHLRVNPELLQRIDRCAGRPSRRAERSHRPRDGGVQRVGRRQVVQALARQGLLPAITFIFSRAGCEAAVHQLVTSDTRLVPTSEGQAIRRLVEERCKDLEPEDLAVLGYWEFIEGLSRGFAAHHAGMLPTFREIVEELFTAGRIQAVFATETLALGINMPARTVVLERLVKFNGISHAELTPAEYTQLTGRAGRRGIDVEGHAVVLWRPPLDPHAVAGLASTRTYPLRSSFRPTYNMATNLIARVGRERSREVLETCFAQFQADRSVVGVSRAVRRNERSLDELAAQMTCHLGDFAEYAGMRQEISRIEKDEAKARTAAGRAQAEVSLGALRIGDVVWLPTGRRAGWAVVVAPQTSGKGGTTPPAVVTEGKQLRRISVADLSGPLVAVDTVRMPKGFNPRSPQSRRDLATTLRIAVSHKDRDGKPGPRGTSAREASREQELGALRSQLRAHPCHGCPDREEHARVAARWWRLQRDTDGLRRTVAQRTTSVAGVFDRVCEQLLALHYLAVDGDELAVTAHGQRLRRLYHEKDLLLAEAVRTGVFQRLLPAELAAVVSAFVHESRGDTEATSDPRPVTPAVDDALDALDRLWRRLADRERAMALPVTSSPDRGIAWAVHRWASGARLDIALRDADLSAGDFVRRCKQIVDLLGQLAVATDHPAARDAADALMRGVVAADRLD